jgi:hypothetical protein
VATLVLLTGFAASAPLRAQTLFAWPSTMSDGTHLTTVDDCLAAVGRVLDSTQLRLPVWKDTLSYAPAQALEKLPPRVIETAATCSAQFDLTTVPPTEFVSMLRLLLYADRNADANTLITQRLAAIPREGDPTARPPLTADSMRIAILDTAIKTIVGAKPVRLQLAIPYIEQVLATPTATLLARISAAFMIGDVARSQGDTVLSRQWLERALTLAATATEADRGQPWYTVAKRGLFSTLLHLNLSEVADSLRRGTDAYIRYAERLWATIEKDEQTKLPFPIGVSAPLLQADYWFTPTGAMKHNVTATTPMVRPVPGRVNLVVFSEVGWRRPGDGWAEGYVLKRLKQQFPALEITVISQTQGFVGAIVPQSSEQEAELYQQRFLDFLQFPVTLGIANTPWWRLEDPDRRRIDQEVANTKEYSFGFATKVESSYSFLIDREGRLVMSLRISRKGYEDLMEALIQALLQQASK